MDKKHEQKRTRRVVASLLTTFFLLQQSMIVPATATNITGVTGSGGVYDIDPTARDGSVGFRQYTDFDLSQGDIANLIFKYGNQDVTCRHCFFRAERTSRRH